VKKQLAGFCLAAGLAFGGLAPVFAVTTAFGSLTPPTSLNYGDSFANPIGQFFDDYLFSVPASEVASVTSTINLANILEIANLQARLYNGTAADITTAGPVSTGVLEGWSTPFNFGFGTVAVIDPITLSAGNYILEITGNVIGSAGGSYSGTLSVIAVPEPQAYALMLAGLGLLGFVARRRRQVDTV
jgi:hypothetical protein